MAVPENVVTGVVAEVSREMQNHEYGQVAIGTFAEAQPNAARYLSAQAKLLGDEGIVHAVFHAHVVSACVQKQSDAPLPVLTFPDLDKAAKGMAEKRLQEAEPAISEYVTTNIEIPPMRRSVAIIALALSAAIENTGTEATET